MSAQPDPLGTALQRAGDQGSNGVQVVDSRVRARGEESPLFTSLKRMATSNPGLAAQAYWDALSATKTTFQGDDGWVVSPDYNVRLKAADSIYNRLVGLPTARTELTGEGGGPISLAALLLSDVSDSI